MKLIPVVKVSRETIESILKSRVGLVQRQTWVNDGSGRKGHYRMQWVSPGEGKDASDYSKQLDLFGGGGEPPKAEAYKPKWPDKGEFVGNGLGDNGREYEGYRAKDGSTHFYDTETGREIGEDGEYLDKKKHEKKQGVEHWRDSLKETEATISQIEKKIEANKKIGGNDPSLDRRLQEEKEDAKSLRRMIAEAESKPSKGEKAKDKAGEYKIYHDTFTGVIDEVVNHLGKQGLYMAEDDVFHKIATGPGRPKNGRTDRYNIPLFTGDGKAAGKAVAFQVYDMDGKKFELNMYVSPMQKDLYESYYDDPVQVRKPNEPEKPAGGDKDFRAAQEWLFKNKYFGEDRVNHSKTHELVDRMKRAGVLTDDLKKKLVNLDTQAILNNKDSNEDEKKWAQATIESAKKGDIDPAVILSAVSGGLFVMGEYVPKKDLPKESIESANILASAIMEMVNKPKESESPTGRKNLAIQTLMDGGKFRKRLEKDRYTGREQFKVRLIDRYGNEVPGVAEATMIELRESGKIKRDRDAVYGSSANEEWVIDQDSGKGPNPVKKSIIERFRNGLAKAFGGE